MKKVIEGKIYNTETASHIGGYSNDLGSGDFRNVDEALYKTKKGAYFLAGEGGAASKYREPCGSGSTGGCGIIALSEKEALEWAEMHLSAGTVVAEFGDLLEEA